MAKRQPAKQSTEAAAEQALAMRFVDEYLKDFDEYLAAIRAGIPRLQAKTKAKALIATLDFQTAIITRVDAMKPSDIVTPQRILVGLMREAGNPRNFGLSKVSALTSVHSILKDIKKDEAEAAANAKQGKKGGVMLVPGTTSLTDWEKAASAAQAKLKKAVTE